MAKKPYSWNQAQYKLAAEISADIGKGLLLAIIVAKLGLAPEIGDIKISSAIISALIFIWLALKLSGSINTK